jgi:beta-1,4-mannosyltransferase
LLAVCVLVKVLTCFRTQLIIDWHNYGFTIMAVNNVSLRLISIARWYELTLGRYGDHHLTVSEAMRQDLMRIVPSLRARANRVHVLYDRATSKFQAELSIQEKFELLSRINLTKIIGYCE